MQLLYKNYNSTESAFIANHTSKIKYLQSESITNDKKSPYYWSAFVYYGEPSPKASDNTSYLIYILFGILIVVILILLISKLKIHGRDT